ncbi:MAG TPA: hypothetical protein VGG74_11885 [Kofleriaceae bacterium]
MASLLADDYPNLPRVLFRSLRRRAKSRVFARTAWWEASRWSSVPRVRGEQPYMSPQRCRAIAMCRRSLVVKPDGEIFDELASKDDVRVATLTDCATGDGLLAGYYARSLFPFPLENRRGQNRIVVPTTAHPPKWRMREAHVRALSWIATGMLGLKKRAVVISHDEMGVLIQRSGRQAGTIMRELCTWGLLHARPIRKAKGAVTSFRACRYQLTQIVLHAWRLRLPAACGKPSELPIGEYREVVKRRRSKAAAIAISTKPLPVIRKEFPGTPDNSLRSYSSGEHAAYRWAVSATPTFDFRTAVPDESVGRSQPEARQGETCDVPSRLYEPESTSTRLELAAERPRVSPDRFIGRTPASRPIPDGAQRERIGEKRDASDERELVWKQREILNAVDRRRRDRDERGRVDDRFDEELLERIDLDPRTQDDLRRKNDSLVDENRERTHYAAPATNGKPSLADDIERAWESFNASRRRPVDTITQDAYRELQKLRDDDGSKGGGK